MLNRAAQQAASDAIRCGGFSNLKFSLEKIE